MVRATRIKKKPYDCFVEKTEEREQLGDLDSKEKRYS